LVISRARITHALNATQRNSHLNPFLADSSHIRQPTRLGRPCRRGLYTVFTHSASRPRTSPSR
jgi:hypothetical protein